MNRNTSRLQISTSRRSGVGLAEVAGLALAAVIAVGAAGDVARGEENPSSSQGTRWDQVPTPGTIGPNSPLDDSDHHDWIFQRGLYTNDAKTGERVDQYQKPTPAYRDPNAWFDSPIGWYPFGASPFYGGWGVFGALPYLSARWYGSAWENPAAAEDPYFSLDPNGK